MTIKEFSEKVALHVIEKLEQQGYLDTTKHKDNLTDVAEIISSVLSGNGEPASPAGTVIAADGTVVTLARQPRNTPPSPPSRIHEL